ncbi:MAG: phosphate transport system permease protein [Thermodesulfobacteriota bacterium]|nr:phosphate transport system permease protein [Thermodesulfobacteriota bacterium]
MESIRRRGIGFVDHAIRLILFFCALLSSTLVVTILAFLFYFTAPVIVDGRITELFGMVWNPISGNFGILPMMVGSLCVSFTALAIAYPLAAGISLFCSGAGPKVLTGKLVILIEFATCVPTVVYAFVSAILLAPLLRSFFEYGSGFSWLAASLTLSILIIPTIVLMINSSMKEVSATVRPVALSLGMTPIQSLTWVEIPQAWKGFVVGFVLGSARAVGDTMISLMLAGNAAQFPGSVLDSVRTLTAHIALVVATDPNSLAYQSIFLSGLILFLISALTNLGLRFVVRSIK